MIHTRFLQNGERGFDTASRLTRAVVAAAKADGITWIAKYVPYGTKDSSKFWHLDEIALCHEFGIACVPIYEVNETRYTGGALVGALDGKRGRQSLNAQGWPSTVPMFIAIDTDIVPDDPKTIIHEGNADIAEPYLAAAFSAEPIARPAGYMDSDGARIMARFNPAVSVPNASYWSKEVWAVRTDPVKRLAVTKAIPGCVMVQFSSGPHYGINVDPCLIVAPLEAWVLAYEPAPTPPVVVPPVIVIPPVIIPTPYPVPIPGVSDMADAKLIHSDNGEIALQLIYDDGYTFHGIAATDQQAVRDIWHVSGEGPISSGLFNDLASKAK